jgi:hypothetical protein
MSHFEVHMYTLCDGFINCWSDIDDNDVESPSTYPTRLAATIELRSFLNEIRQAVLDGDIEEAYPLSDFKVVEIPV